MLINTYQKILGAIIQWLNVTSDMLNPKRALVKISVQHPDEHREYKLRQYNAQQALMHKSKYKR